MIAIKQKYDVNSIVLKFLCFQTGVLVLFQEMHQKTW